MLDENSNTNHNGTKVYDSVSETYKTVKEEVDLPGIALVEKADESKGAVNDIILTIWFLSVSTIGVYVIIRNRKLWKETNTLDVVGQIEGIDICLSHEVKTPCLVGVRNPRILITKETYENTRLYEYAVRHELAHFHQKDHLWNAGRVAMCAFYWWNPLVLYVTKCVAEDAELACDARVLEDASFNRR